MGLPEYDAVLRQAGAAPITPARYTHMMPDAIERAREQLDVWLANETAHQPAADR